jgi:hypothetical protein
VGLFERVILRLAMVRVELYHGEICASLLELADYSPWSCESTPPISLRDI